MGPHEPYWRTNTSFSPPPQRWDFRFQNEPQSFGSQEGSRLYGSSTSSNSRSWLRGGYLPNHRHSVSDGIGPFFSSPSELSPAQQWTPPTIQEISLDEYGNSSKRVLGPVSFSPTSEGLSDPHDGRASISSNSDSSDFTARGCFMSKQPVHPLSFPVEPNTPRFQDFDDTRQSDFDFSDFSEPDSINRSNGHRCNLCERFLTQRSPWSSRQIIRSGDMPVTGVLSCRHVFHAECLDQTTPKTQKSDPVCPACAKSEAKNSPDPRVLSRSKTGAPRVKPFREDGPSWGCAQAGNCVEGALSAPSRNAMLLLNRNRVKKSISMKKAATCSPQSGGGGGGVGGDGVGCSSSRKKS